MQTFKSTAKILKFIWGNQKVEYFKNCQIYINQKSSHPSPERHKHFDTRESRIIDRKLQEEHDTKCPGETRKRKRLRERWPTKRRDNKHVAELTALWCLLIWKDSVSRVYLDLSPAAQLHLLLGVVQMLVKQKEANRQSMLLLQSAEPSVLLLKALEDVAVITKTLEEERLQHQQQVKPQTFVSPQPRGFGFVTLASYFSRFSPTERKFNISANIDAKTIKNSNNLVHTIYIKGWLKHLL